MTIRRDLDLLVDEGIATAQDRVKVVSLIVIAGTSGPQSATLTLAIDGKDAIPGLQPGSRGRGRCTGRRSRGRRRAPGMRAIMSARGDYYPTR